MLRTAWDFFLSFSIRGVCTLLLIGGVEFLEWTYHAWRTNHWKDDDPNMVWMCLILAGSATAAGALGTFRRGKAEKDFSATQLLGVAAGASMGSIHTPTGTGRGRTLRRFPALESYILGCLTIALCVAMILWKDYHWALRNGISIGAVQMLWGFAMGRAGLAGTRGDSGTDPGAGAGATEL